MIRSLLIANRGEIACRIARTCRRLGVRSVAVYSEADAGAPHVAAADEAFLLGPPPAAESYLRVDRLLEAARRTGAEAVHPGYGFLAENADFARAVIEAGLTWVGPPPEAIRAMGDKREARARMAAAGVPVVPGGEDAAAVGFPLMIKPTLGGGGKGMRRVDSPADFEAALAAARREARQAFGSDDVMLERALHAPRHVEVQVFGDASGRVVHLGERECSVQRRHQKILEETPAPGLAEEVRRALHEAGVAAARAVGYVGAGTVEFLLEPDGCFWFLEMNTRLQVEHPVTEMVGGLDLVEWQLRVASGEPFTAAWEPRGHAVEVRLYAEDPDRDFLPATGRVLRWNPSRDVRVDAGIAEGMPVTPWYDPLLAKIVGHGETREEALRRLVHALDETVLLGVISNLGFLRRLVRHPKVLSGELFTSWLEHEPFPVEGTPEEAWVEAVAGLWRSAGGRGWWRNVPGPPRRFRLGDGRTTRELAVRPPQVEMEGRAWSLQAPGRVVRDGEDWWVDAGGRVARLREVPLLGEARAAEADGVVRAPMPGAVLEVYVAAGDTVAAGQPLLKIEAMKMEHTLTSRLDGVIEGLACSPGDRVAADAVLARVHPAPASPPA